MIYDVIIAGAGPAGLTAAIYACRGGLRTVSYTHLDVYKRQVLESANPAFTKYGPS